jgi:hypothetical protein
MCTPTSHYIKKRELDTFAKKIVSIEKYKQAWHNTAAFERGTS